MQHRVNFGPTQPWAQHNSTALPTIYRMEVYFRPGGVPPVPPVTRPLLFSPLLPPTTMPSSKVNFHATTPIT